jgi:hypothetical protein
LLDFAIGAALRDGQNGSRSDEGVAVQAVDYPKLRARLLADGQVLEWRPAAP